MGKSKGVKVKAPDPTPMARDEKETDLQVEQDERRRNARGLTRAKTILAGDLQVDNVAVTQKGNKTILGG